jgi:hypothetical protein
MGAPVPPETQGAPRSLPELLVLPALGALGAQEGG